jgi:hypothetical protein
LFQCDFHVDVELDWDVEHLRHDHGPCEYQHNECDQIRHDDWLDWHNQRHVMGKHNRHGMCLVIFIVNLYSHFITTQIDNLMLKWTLFYKHVSNTVPIFLKTVIGSYTHYGQMHVLASSMLLPLNLCDSAHYDGWNHIYESILWDKIIASAEFPTLKLI